MNVQLGLNWQCNEMGLPEIIKSHAIEFPVMAIRCSLFVVKGAPRRMLVLGQLATTMTALRAVSPSRNYPKTTGGWDTDTEKETRGGGG